MFIFSFCVPGQIADSCQYPQQIYSLWRGHAAQRPASPAASSVQPATKFETEATLVLKARLTMREAQRSGACSYWAALCFWKERLQTTLCIYAVCEAVEAFFANRKRVRATKTSHSVQINVAARFRIVKIDAKLGIITAKGDNTPILKIIPK